MGVYIWLHSYLHYIYIYIYSTYIVHIHKLIRNKCKKNEICQKRSTLFRGVYCKKKKSIIAVNVKYYKYILLIINLTCD